MIVKHEREDEETIYPRVSSFLNDEPWLERHESRSSRNPASGEASGTLVGRAAAKRSRTLSDPRRATHHRDPSNPSCTSTMSRKRTSTNMRRRNWAMRRMATRSGKPIAKQSVARRRLNKRSQRASEGGRRWSNSGKRARHRRDRRRRRLLGREILRSRPLWRAPG